MKNGSKRPRVLIIEDNEPLRTSLVDLLEHEGMETVAAENGLLGLQYAVQCVPDIVLCDIMMPEMDGYEVLERIRANQALMALPVIFLTARVTHADVRTGMAHGADDYITKPFSADDLIISIRTQLEKKAALEKLTEARMDDLRNRIILTLPHELRTPLTALIGYSEILAEDCRQMPAEQVASIAQAMQQSTQRLWRMVENYLIYSQLEVFGTKPEWLNNLRRIPAYAPEDQVTLEAQRLGKEHRRLADLTIDCEPTYTGVAISPEYLRKIAYELIRNAFGFSTPGTPIQISTTIADTYFRISISNHGRPITEDQVSRIGAFIQFDREKHEQQGSGLGLCIVKRLIDLHQGLIDIQHEPLNDELGITTIQVAIPLMVETSLVNE